MMCKVDVTQAVLAIVTFLLVYAWLGGEVAASAALAGLISVLVVALAYGALCFMGRGG